MEQHQKEKKYFLCANWKMNGSMKGLPAYFESFFQGIKDEGGLSPRQELYFAVPFPLIEKVANYPSLAAFGVLAQNVHHLKEGAFTGEVSVPMLLEVGAKGSVIGHSERRSYYNETDDLVALKAKALLESGLVAVCCIGETLNERQQNLTLKVIEKQLAALCKPLMEGLDPLAFVSQFVVAYEPIWAIGTGLAATPEQAEEVHLFIRSFLIKTFGSETGAAIRIIYGGSMNEKNTHQLIQKSDIEGGLIGGASLKPAEFSKMYSILAKR